MPPFIIGTGFAKRVFSCRGRFVHGAEEHRMTISTDRFETEGRFATYDPYHTPLAHARVGVFILQCRACGFEPENVVTPPPLCPKCHGKSWERFAKPGSILENADRY
jgi:hypothetical protein